MPRAVSKKLKVVDVAENEAVEEKVEEPKTDAQEMTSIKEEIESTEAPTKPTEPVIMKTKRKAKAKPKPKPIEETPIEETPIEETPIQDIEETPEVSQKVRREKAKYMREYRKIPSDNERAVLQELDQQKEEKIKSKQVDKPEASKPKTIERSIEKTAKIIKVAPDYNSIPEDIIEKLIKKRQTTVKEQRQVKRTGKIKKCASNIA